MPRQKDKIDRSSIELSQKDAIKEIPAYKILITAAFAANVSATVLTSTTSNYVLDFQNENIHIEQIKDSSVNQYPIISLRYEEGKVKESDSILKSNYIKQEVINEETSVDITFRQIIGDLRKENAVLRRRLEKSLPTHAIIYMVGSGIVGAIASTLLALRFYINIYTVDPYYLVCSLIAALGLFFAALVSLKDWKGNLLR